MFSMFWSFAVRPAIRTAGSPPGTTMKMRKTTKLTTTRTRAIPISRLTRNVSTARSSMLDPHLRARIERVAKAVAEDVERQHREDDREPRRECQPRRRRDPLLTRCDQRSPRRVRRLDARAQERKRGLGQDVVGDDQREEDEHARRNVRKDLREHDARRARALGDRRFDELLLAEREDLAAQRPPDVRDQDVRDDERRNPEAPRLDVEPEVVEAVDRQCGTERDREQDDGEGPDQVEEARDRPV